MSLLTDIPSWATTPEAQAFAAGFGAGAVIMLFRAGLRWFRSVADEPPGGD